MLTRTIEIPVKIQQKRCGQNNTYFEHLNKIIAAERRWWFFSKRNEISKFRIAHRTVNFRFRGSREAIHTDNRISLSLSLSNNLKNAQSRSDPLARIQRRSSRRGTHEGFTKMCFCAKKPNTLSALQLSRASVAPEKSVSRARRRLSSVNRRPGDVAEGDVRSSLSPNNEPRRGTDGSTHFGHQPRCDARTHRPSLAASRWHRSTRVYYAGIITCTWQLKSSSPPPPHGIFSSRGTKTRRIYYNSISPAARTPSSHSHSLARSLTLSLSPPLSRHDTQHRSYILYTKTHTGSDEDKSRLLDDGAIRGEEKDDPVRGLSHSLGAITARARTHVRTHISTHALAHIHTLTCCILIIHLNLTRI